MALHFFPANTQSLGETQPELRMILFALFFVNKILQKELAHLQILALRMDRTQEAGEFLFETVVLFRVPLQFLAGQLPGLPPRIKSMPEHMSLLDLLFQARAKCLHLNHLSRWANYMRGI